MNCSPNIITANFSGGKTSATTAPLWQWDYGQVLCITGIEDLPAAFEVHFSTNKSGGVSTVAVGADGQVTIPNVLLTIGKSLNAWIYLSDAQGEGETEYAITIPVKARPMPETYDAEATGVFDDVVRQVSEYAETAQTAADNAGASASAAAASADSAAASATAAAGSATAAAQSKADAALASRAASTAAQDAKRSADAAAEDAGEAAISAHAAMTYRDAAEAAATEAKDAKADATTAAGRAESAATAAGNAASGAGQAATAAGQYATSAGEAAGRADTAAQTATTKAADATAAAETAVDAKTAAQTAQQGAETAETNAGQSASTATTKAAEAAQSATDAASAKTAAESAATRAEQAAATLTVDTALSDTSTNPVQNKVITGELTDVKSQINHIGADVTPLSLTVDVIDDNPNSVITSDGAVAETASAIGVSNPLYCKPGATLTYKLSTQNTMLILAVYGATGQMNYSVAGTGYSSYITGSYTFTNADAYYRICGVTGSTYRNNYSLDYDYFPPHIVRKETYDADIDAINAAINYGEPTEVKTLLTNGGGIKTDGTIYATEAMIASYSYCDYIPLKKGTTITYTGVRVTNLCAIAPYDTDKVFDSTHAVIASTTISGAWTMPFDGYVRLCCRNTELNGNASFVILNSIGSELASLDSRVDALEGGIPSEWQTYLATKKTDIKAALVAIGSTGEAFTFVTDVHVPRNNMLTPKILRELGKDCPVNYHINGGDFIDINTDSAQSAINVLWQWKDAMHGMTEYCALGNHDYNNYNGENQDNILTAGQYYAVMDRQIEDIVDTAGRTYYCIDNDSQKIRIIVLDTSLADKTTMYAWMSERMTELDSTWTILVIQHYLWGSNTDTIHTNGQATIAAINAIYSQISAEFIGILAGHTHVDHNATESVNGYLLIARDTNMVKGGTGTDSLSFDYVTINTTAKTINFTKIGRGSDLSLSY